MTRKRKRSHIGVNLGIIGENKALLFQTMGITSKLAQKAYPDLTLDQLEAHIIDQFINEHEVSWMRS